MFKNKMSQRGFTLIELIIAIAIIGILVRIAYPAYTESVNRAKRAQAQTAIVSLAQAMERGFSAYNGYYATAKPSSSTAPTLPAAANSSTPAAPGAAPAAAFFATNVPAAGTPLYTLGIVFTNGPTAGTSTTAGYDGYMITATRKTGSSMANDTCGDYTLTAAGAKGLVNNTGGKTVATCWK